MLGDLLRRARGVGDAPRTPGAARWGLSSAPVRAGQYPTLSAAAELPPANLDGFLVRRRERSAMVTPEEAAELMGRTVEEIHALAWAGVLECEAFEHTIVRVRPVKLRGPRF